MGLGSTFLEAFAELRDRMESTDAEALDYHASISEGEITQFLKEPQTERFLMQTAYSAFTPEEYPTHSALLDLMFFSRLPEQQAANQKFSSLCYYSPTVQPPLCGTLRHVAATNP